MITGDFMGNIISSLLPPVFFVKLYKGSNKEKKTYIITYLKTLFISNIITMFIIYKYFNFKNFEKSIEFTLRYAVISLIVNIIMIIIYKVITNYIEVKIETKKVSKK